jgi:hypothetical protein
MLEDKHRKSLATSIHLFSAFSVPLSTPLAPLVMSSYANVFAQAESPYRVCKIERGKREGLFLIFLSFYIVISNKMRIQKVYKGGSFYLCLITPPGSHPSISSF